ncbi:DUF2470 domain-containing protein [Micromonospora sp. WMMD1082]|uniref:DUF2470 domain-containing protein n=1 Tax=Micromonospora sp. WMMD1082 TaxID=3016104 RepID=UPI002415DEE0|nr:DUF2470 domain-containing protein [Micromonospora sp. WMMD1082]MDG4797160.1 DUF2470 domain-containing protein [Micromonospora sp. WMMD1082]
MQPSRAEIARTLASSTAPATVVARHLPTVSGVRHGAADDGRILLLCRRGDPLTTTARNVLVHIADEPPLPFSPTWGRVRVGGRATPLTGDAARTAADAVAATLPDPDLLDVGHGSVIVEVVPKRVTLTGRERELPVNLAHYRHAAPDPVVPAERPFLVDLVDHHGPQLYPFLRQQLVIAGIDVPADCLPCPLRLDRYGLLVSVPAGSGTATYRLCFTPPLQGQQDLMDRLHPVLFHHRCDHH